MTFTYKLARRLARLREFRHISLMLVPLLIAISACAAGEPTGPSGALNADEGATGPVVVSPRRVTLESSQRVLFSAFSSALPGSSQVTSIEWTANGGTISADGTFSSSSTGNFKVVGKRRGNPHNQPDTSTVVVVAAQPSLTAVTVSPATAGLIAGQQQQFDASGTLSDGSSVAIGVTWSATGGTIDAGGFFSAGNVDGTYRVIATHSTTGEADTSIVTIKAVRSLTMTPADVALGPSGTQQYAVTGSLSDGTSTPITSVAYSANAGSISGSGFYTAPSAAGSYTVSAKLAAAGGTSVGTSTGVTVSSAGAPIGVSGFPHQPSDYSRFAEANFSGLPSVGAGVIAGGWTEWTWGGGNADVSIANDPSAPASPSGVLAIKFPAGEPVGSGSGAVQGWVTADNNSTQMREVYESAWFKIPSSNFETPGPGMKLLGYWGVGQAGSKVPAQVYSFINGNGTSTSLMSSWTLDIRQQNQVSRSMVANRSSKKIRAGVWQRYEIQMVLNDVDVPNGILRVWLDNADGTGLTLTHEYTDVMYRTSAGKSADGIDSRSGFYGRRWDPIWGGMGGSAKTRNDYLWIDHIYIAGKPM